MESFICLTGDFMYIDNKRFSFFFKLLIVLMGTYGLYKACFFNKVSLEEHFSYYTNLSNLICVIYFLIIIVRTVIVKKIDTKYYGLKGAVVVMIAVTGLVYNFILRPFMSDVEGVMDLHSFSNYIVHLIIPVMVILDWLLFDKKGNLKSKYSIYWLVIPFMYWIFICIRANFAKPFMYTGSKYPYFFIDIEEFGVGIVIVNVILAIAAILLLGFILCKIDNKLSKKA